jgi:hypothetical protein
VKFEDMYKKGLIKKPGFAGGVFLIKKEVFISL